MSTPPPEIDPQRLQTVIGQARAFVLSHIQPSGRILSPGHAGLPSTAYVIITFHFLGADGIDFAAAGRFVAAHQLPDGAFPSYPDDTTGDPWSTALALTALRIVADPENAAAIARGEAWLDAHGGQDIVDDGLYRLNINPLYVALGGGMDPAALPGLDATPLLLEPVWREAAKTVNVAFLWMGIAVWAIVRRLQDPERAAHPAWVARAEHKRALAILSAFQNDNGSFNATVFQTTLAAAAMQSLGLTTDDPPLQRALHWLRQTRDPGQDSRYASWRGFNTGIWSTALSVRALLVGGVSRSDPRINDAIRWLTTVQINTELSPLVPSAPGAPRSGGWPFESDNHTVPDADDAAMALGALGLALQGEGDDRLTPAVAALAQASADRGLAWLLGMQNDDGGWPAFQWGLPSKPPGPFLVSYPHFRRGHLLQELLTAHRSLCIFGDPSTEDITARTLFGLAQLGFDTGSPAVQRAIDFLMAQQCTPEQVGCAEEGPGAPWWSRWITNYLAGTSYVLGGLAAVGADLHTPAIQGAIAWVKARQNPNGGWGERPGSYQDPSQAGRGPSMPITTAITLCGLIQAGEGHSESVRRGIQYLLDTASDDGIWPGAGMLHVFYRTDTFYQFTLARSYYPLEALGRYARLLEGAPDVAVGDTRADTLPDAPAAADLPPVRDAAGAWSRAGLLARQQVGDPLADTVIHTLLADGDVAAANDLFGRLVRNAAPLPPGLPDPAAAYFAQTADLPPWAEPGRLALAARMFERLGWATGIGLFNASLPQIYADPAIARVLLGTRGLVDVPQRRILETAQFIFDVAQTDAFAPDGGGIRAAQKLRLLHAAARHLTASKAAWDPAWGVPINQEEQAMTLLSFSVVLLAAWEKMGIDTSREEQEAWLHLWAVVGHIMGLERDLLPTDPDDAQALWEVLTAARWGASEAGRELVQGLLRVSAVYVPHWHGINLSVSMLRYFSGDVCCDLLQVDRADWTRAALRVARWLRGGRNPLKSRFLRGQVQQLSTGLVKALIGAMREGKQTRFRIPTSLVRAWNLED